MRYQPAAIRQESQSLGRRLAVLFAHAMRDPGAAPLLGPAEADDTRPGLVVASNNWAPASVSTLGTPMTAVLFDTLELARALRDKAHFTPEQAEGAADAMLCGRI
jgi:hypothetical protein